MVEVRTKTLLLIFISWLVPSGQRKSQDKGWRAWMRSSTWEELGCCKLGALRSEDTWPEGRWGRGGRTSHFMLPMDTCLNPNLCSCMPKDNLESKHNFHLERGFLKSSPSDLHGAELTLLGALSWVRCAFLICCSPARSGISRRWSVQWSPGKQLPRIDKGTWNAALMPLICIFPEEIGPVHYVSIWCVFCMSAPNPSRGYHSFTMCSLFSHLPSPILLYQTTSCAVKHTWMHSPLSLGERKTRQLCLSIQDEKLFLCIPVFI